MLTGACGLAAAGRLRRGGRSLAATFVIGESLPLEGAAPTGAMLGRAERALPHAGRDVPVQVPSPAQWRDEDDWRARGVQ